MTEASTHGYDHVLNHAHPPTEPMLVFRAQAPGGQRITVHGPAPDGEHLLIVCDPQTHLVADIALDRWTLQTMLCALAASLDRGTDHTPFGH